MRCRHLDKWDMDVLCAMWVAAVHCLQAHKVHQCPHRVWPTPRDCGRCRLWGSWVEAEGSYCELNPVTRQDYFTTVVYRYYMKYVLSPFLSRSLTPFKPCLLSCNLLQRCVWKRIFILFSCNFPIFKFQLHFLNSFQSFNSSPPP